ncbi:MAG: hypothetical protein ACI4MK_02750 [Aristaeellaceae bacterium]
MQSILSEKTDTVLLYLLSLCLSKPQAALAEDIYTFVGSKGGVCGKFTLSAAGARCNPA